MAEWITPGSPVSTKLRDDAALVQTWDSFFAVDRLEGLPDVPVFFLVELRGEVQNRALHPDSYDPDRVREDLADRAGHHRGEHVSRDSLFDFDERFEVVVESEVQEVKEGDANQGSRKP